MQEQFGVEFGWADQYIVAALLPDDVAQLLEVPSGTPATEVRRTTYSKDHVPIEYVQSWTRSEFPLIVHLEAR
jgi:DNA-binding GntR family transcriptional regulator